MSTTRPTSEVVVGGCTYRVQSTADDDLLQKLAAVVDARLKDLPHNQRSDPKSLVLVALALAHDLQQERSEREEERTATAVRLRGLLQRVDSALDHQDEKGDLLTPVPESRPTAAPQAHVQATSRPAAKVDATDISQPAARYVGRTAAVATSTTQASAQSPSVAAQSPSAVRPPASDTYVPGGKPKTLQRGSDP